MQNQAILKIRFYGTATGDRTAELRPAAQQQAPPAAGGVIATHGGIGHTRTLLCDWNMTQPSSSPPPLPGVVSVYAGC